MRLIDADKLKIVIHRAYSDDLEILDKIDDAETVEAIPVPWIEAEIKKLRDMDNGFTSLSAGQIEAMLKKWREEQNGQRNGITGMEADAKRNRY